MTPIARSIQLVHIMVAVVQSDRSVILKVTFGRNQDYRGSLTFIILIDCFNPVIQLLITRLLVDGVAEQYVGKLVLLSNEILGCHMACQVYKVYFERGLIIDGHDLGYLVN